MKAIKFVTVFISLLMLSLAGCGEKETNVGAQQADLKMSTAIPPEITTPDRVETRIGALNFFDGMPDAATVEKAYDNLDFLRGVEVFLNAMPGASLYAYREGARKNGYGNGEIAIMDVLRATVVL